MNEHLSTQVPIRTVAIHIGDGEQHPLEVNYADVRVTLRDIESYILRELATKSVYEELLLSKLGSESLSDSSNNKKVWGISWIVTKKQLYDIWCDKRLHEIILPQSNIRNLKVRFEKECFEEWKRKQYNKKLIPTPTISQIKQDIDNSTVKIYVNYPKDKPIYQLRYRYYENEWSGNINQDEIKGKNDSLTSNNFHKNNSNIEEAKGKPWKSCNKSFITLTNLWMFKTYTIEVCVENRFSRKLGTKVRNYNIERCGQQRITFETYQSRYNLNTEKDSQSNNTSINSENKDTDVDNKEKAKEKEKKLSNEKELVKEEKTGKMNENSSDKQTSIVETDKHLPFGQLWHDQFYC